jgi:hypothetical protein
MESSKRSSRAEFWQNVLQQFTESKLSVVDFCSQKGLAVQSFYQCGIAVPVLCFLLNTMNWEESKCPHQDLSSMDL